MKRRQKKFFGTNNDTNIISSSMPGHHTNSGPKRLKAKIDIVEKPENQVQRLTDSNGSLFSALSFKNKAYWVYN